MWNACASQPYNSDPKVKKMCDQEPSWKSSGEDEEEDEHTTWSAAEEEESNPSTKGTWYSIFSSMFSWLPLTPLPYCKRYHKRLYIYFGDICRGRRDITMMG